jgi:HEAT repeats
MFRLGFSLLLFAFSLRTETSRIGSINFFGTSGVDLQKVSSVLPIRSGGSISEDQGSSVRNEVDLAITGAIGHATTDIAFVCCEDRGRLSIFIGLGGKNTKAIPLGPMPEGSTCLAANVIDLYKAMLNALTEAIQSGRSGEDDSRGYSLSADPNLHAKQIAMRQYAVDHQQTLINTLQGCGSQEARQAAAEILGYGKQTTAQIDALVRVTRDPDDGVRNNAVRALWVLATASPKTASEIPAASFIEMLNSGLWTDRNKAGQLLLAVTTHRNAKLLERLATSALPSLIEMAKWHDSEHAYAYRLLLGRIAGLEETRIRELIRSGNVDEIIAAAKSRS